MAGTSQPVRVLFCCMGNICRSPTAEGVFRHMVQAAGLQDHIVIDSAGTHDYHIGDPPDGRAQAAAVARGYDLADLRARQVADEDFQEFDYILAMDEDNLSVLRSIAPVEHRGKVKLFLSFSTARKGKEVPDPYFKGPGGFALVLDMVEEGGAGLLADIKKKLGL